MRGPESRPEMMPQQDDTPTKSGLSSRALVDKLIWLAQNDATTAKVVNALGPEPTRLSEDNILSLEMAGVLVSLIEINSRKAFGEQSMPTTEEYQEVWNLLNSTQREENV